MFTFWTFNHSCGYSKSHLNLGLAEASSVFSFVGKREGGRKLSHRVSNNYVSHSKIKPLCKFDGLFPL